MTGLATQANKKLLRKAAQDLLQLYPDVSALGSPFNTENETFGLSSEFRWMSAMFCDLLFQSAYPITASPPFLASVGVTHENAYPVNMTIFSDYKWDTLSLEREFHLV
ncbi:hypothetical protein C8J56DRAFT_1040282 [Mycena floridula]|nr:hypothetical protein C8J56DRAFT_1040282 [Mycena floridula]